MPKKSRGLEDLFAQTCEACYGYFDTTQGLMAHQSTSRQCRWYKKGKLREIFVDSEDSSSENEVREDLSQDQTEDEGEYEDEDEAQDLIFVPTAGPSRTARTAESSSAPARRTAIALDDDDDTRVEVVDQKAGAVRGEGQTVQEAWRHHLAKRKDKDRQRCAGNCHTNTDLLTVDEDDPPKSLWEPFESETDWEIASWCIKEGISQGAVDRFLDIPSVREKLGLSYHNTRALLQKVDSLPERARWKEHWLSFKDRPGERHLLQFRCIIEAIKALLGNPAHSDHIVYRPSWMFSDATKQNRIYSEMWTGKWWHAVQVSLILLSQRQLLTSP
ncbi:uncharacterized protein B0H18DRAFT_884862 [Fomitopsis serialis]|uniref:uncharacterized protein n=1 Tax=Fomitopsis serialis TaxID=139415 RepID=UPI0020076285|nr:uncharacterized protein B0H18DRAFT_884862 [Neoantrodia serialis]KAH9916359.1 hypothetical protein B0H18DRAFT_884862 [Neoantrodia serialis]